MSLFMIPVRKPGESAQDYDARVREEHRKWWNREHRHQHRIMMAIRIASMICLPIIFVAVLLTLR